MTTATTYTVTVPPDKARYRLDRLLADALPALSRTRLKSLIEAGQVRTDCGVIDDAAYRVSPGQLFTVAVPAAPPAQPQAQSRPLSIVYEDDELIVVDKPAGFVVHPGAGNPDNTLVNALLAHCGDRLSAIGAPLRPGIVHRLDKDTSGLLVVAKTDAAHLILARGFAQHRIERAYLALVWGNPNPPAGRIASQVGRSSADRTKMAVRNQGGKTAVTNYRTVQLFGGVASLIECRLATGRTHQIRVHMASLNHPIVGDQTYGRRAPMSGTSPTVAALGAFPRQALHAYLIGFQHPKTAELLCFRSDLPCDFRSLVTCLEE